MKVAHGRLLLLVLLGVLGGAAPSGAGPLVIVGGGLAPENEPIFRTILDLRLPGKPICVIPLASGIPKRSMKSYLADFVAYGGPEAAVGIPLTHKKPRRASDPRFVSRLKKCGGFFFTGGDQSRIVDVLRPGGIASPADRAIRSVWDRGAVVAGSSAGAAMMGDPMIGSGDSGDALEVGIADTDGERGVWVRDGMGFFQDGILGQHHLARGRFGRLLVAVAGVPATDRGFGIDENTALVVEGNRARVVGESQVAVMQLEVAEGPDERRGTLTLLGDGDRFDLDSNRFSVAAGKPLLAADQDDPVAPEDAWKDDAFHRWLVGLALSRASAAAFRSGSRRLSFEKAPDFETRGEAAVGNGIPAGFMAGPFLFEVHTEQ